MSDATITVNVPAATGTVARRVVEQLREAGAPVRASSRGGDPRFDWADRSTWAPALRPGPLFLALPHEVPLPDDFLETARGAGVTRVVLLSSKAIEAMGDERLLSAERAVVDGGLPWTVLRADWFDQNFDEGFARDAVLAGEVAMPLGEVRQGFVDADDIAAVAVRTLLDDGHAGARYEVTGPELLSFGEAVELIARATGREIRYDGGDDAYARLQRGFGLPEEAVQGALGAFAALRALGDTELSDTVQRVTGRPPRPFAEYARRAAAAGAWS